MEHRKSSGPGCRSRQLGRRPHRGHRCGEACEPRGVEEPMHVRRHLSGPWEVFRLSRLSWQDRGRTTPRPAASHPASGLPETQDHAVAKR